jgi:hypothetical protein
MSLNLEKSTNQGRRQDCCSGLSMCWLGALAAPGRVLVDGRQLGQPQAAFANGWRRSMSRPSANLFFGSPVYTKGAQPTDGRGEAAFWLPLLGLYTGARLNELAPLGAADVTTDLAEGRRLKTVGSRRSVPVHTELLRIGFTDFVDHVRKRNGANGRLFPLLTGRLRRGVVEVVRALQARAWHHEQGQRLPFVPARLQGCLAGRRGRRGCQ